jgi:heme-degrading monooxygenase HmoA
VPSPPLRPVASDNQAKDQVLAGGVAMFARKAFFRLKSISMSLDFRQAFDNEVLPLMRRQKGFVGLVMLANPGSLERITTSLWRSAADADSYDEHAYQQVLKILSRTVEGFPKIRTYDEVTFTLHNGVAQEKTEEAMA